jgi:hypothetical protein
VAERGLHVRPPYLRDGPDRLGLGRPGLEPRMTGDVLGVRVARSLDLVSWTPLARPTEIEGGTSLRLSRKQGAAPTTSTAAVYRGLQHGGRLAYHSGAVRKAYSCCALQDATVHTGHSRPDPATVTVQRRR